MGGFPFFDLEKRLFLPYLSTKLSQEAEIRYVHLVNNLNVSFGHLDFSAQFHPLAAQKKWFFGRFFLFFEFVSPITPLQIKLGT